MYLNGLQDKSFTLAPGEISSSSNLCELATNRRSYDNYNPLGKLVISVVAIIFNYKYFRYGLWLFENVHFFFFIYVSKLCDTYRFRLGTEYRPRFSSVLQIFILVIYFNYYSCITYKELLTYV